MQPLSPTIRMSNPHYDKTWGSLIGRGDTSSINRKRSELGRGRPEWFNQGLSTRVYQSGDDVIGKSAPSARALAK